jgi:hypothetical protein
MPITEQDAATKWCPMARVSNNTGTAAVNRQMDGNPLTVARCVASRCALWVRADIGTFTETIKVVVTEEGLNTLVSRQVYRDYRFGYDLFEAKGVKNLPEGFMAIADRQFYAGRPIPVGERLGMCGLVRGDGK